ncbi:MAG: hypothetical protein ACXVEI_12400 [Actinomycetota bacterium]
MTERARRSDELLGAEVVLTGWDQGREHDLREALDQIDPGATFDIRRLPLVVLRRTSVAKGAWARELLEAAGAEVTVNDAWVTRDQAPDGRTRPVCPSCGSLHTQPFTHAGPVARVNMKCTDCGHLFHS